MSYQVRFWSIKTVKNRRRPFGVRWIVGGQEKSEWFVTKTLAEHFRSELVQAARRGEAFDTVTGLPESKQRTHKAGSWYDHARAYTARNWSGSAAKTRATVADCLASVSRGLILDERGHPALRLCTALSQPGRSTGNAPKGRRLRQRSRLPLPGSPRSPSRWPTWKTRPSSGTPSTEWRSTWTENRRRLSRSRGGSRCSAPAWTTPLNSKSFRQIRSAVSGGRCPRRRARSTLDRCPTLSRLGRCWLLSRSSPLVWDATSMRSSPACTSRASVLGSGRAAPG